MASNIGRGIRHISSSSTLRSGHAASAGGGGGGAALWKKMFFFVGIPAIGLGMVNAYLGHVADHAKPRPEFIPYEYLRIRTKRFPWGDGNHSLFHNPRVNPLPDGYEEEEEPHH